MNINPIDIRPLLETSTRTPPGNVSDPKQEFLYLFLREMVSFGKVSSAGEEEPTLANPQIKAIQEDLVREALLRQMVGDKQNGLYQSFFREDS